MAKIEKKDWSQAFMIVGQAKINDYTFSIDKKSSKDWIYNNMNLGIYCGEEYGTVYVNMMGGYSASGNSIIYAHGKNEDGTDDFKSNLTIDWDDRFNENIISDAGDLCFITVGLEKTDKDKRFDKKFLSSYDAIKYIQEHLVNGMTIRVKGRLKYNLYNDKITVQKEITSIVIDESESDKYKATFTQTILLDSESVTKDDIDKEKNLIYVNARVLDYVKEINGVEIKGQYPFRYTFEFGMDLSNEKQCAMIMDKVFKVKKDITQITFEGKLIESGSTVTATIDDIPDDIKDLIACGVFTEEEALAKCSANGDKIKRMVLTKPVVKMTGDDKSIPVLQKFEERYTEEDLMIDVAEEKTDENDNSSSSDDSNLDWLKNL